MRKKHLLLLLLLLIICLIVNSCKKNDQGSVAKLFIGGTWQLASINVVNYVGNTEGATDTLNTTCTKTQFFTFTGNSCVYNNFDCITQTSAPASWSLTPNQLFLISNVVCKDSTSAGSSKPFLYAKIQNLGQYSMILLTGDIQPNYSLTKIRKITQYGFVRVKAE